MGRWIECGIGGWMWWGNLFLYRQSGGTETDFAGGSCGCTAERVAGGKARHPFHIDAMVILPDHLHALWTLPLDDGDYPTRWMLIKAGFSRRIPAGERRNKSRMTKGERGIWQHRYWEHLIRDERDYVRHVDYIHSNPVKHGYVRRVAYWPHSTFHRFVARGIYPSDWEAGEVMDDENFGE